jgi:Zn-dependent protease/CBS domain-containing protein
VKWSWKIVTVSGIPVYVHGTFLLLVVFLIARDLGAGLGLPAALASTVFLLVVFTTVVLHEFGHAFMARRYGIQTKDITLLPIGGLARLERLPDVPRQELYVALAGPAVNLALAAGAFVVGSLLGAGFAVPTIDASGGGMLGRFIAINLWLALFNLIPAFPMDGGRALRALLAERYDYPRATEIAANLGQGLALVFGLVGIFSNPFLMFIALFVWMGATAEASAVSLRSAIAGTPVGHAMITDFRSLDAGDSLQQAADWVVAGSQQDFPVLDGGRLVGVLTRDALVKAISARGLSSPVRDAMSSAFQVADAREMLEPAFARLQACACPVLPVLSEGRVVGLLTAENVGEYVMLRSAVAGRRVAGRA